MNPARVSSRRLTWPDLTAALIQGEDLSQAETAWAMGEIMAGEASPVQITGFMVALRAKGESVDEFAGLVEAMMANAVRIDVPGPAVDIVGTGGDRQGTVNVSTMAGLVAAGAGARVVKHGNRAASSKSGTADVLEALGVRLDLAPERVAEVATECGMTLCFAQVFHPALRHAAIARRELALPTAFNFLGPMTNPAQPLASAVGCADARMAPVMAGVLAARGRRALVFRGSDGLDELTTTGTSDIWWVRDGQVTAGLLDPADLGIARADLDDLRGGTPAENAEVVRRVLGGEPGPVRDIVILNAAAALVALDDTGTGTRGLVDALEPAIARARESIDSGAAADVLTRWVAATS